MAGFGFQKQRGGAWGAPALVAQDGEPLDGKPCLAGVLRDEFAQGLAGFLHAAVGNVGSCGKEEGLDGMALFVGDAGFEQLVKRPAPAHLVDDVFLGNIGKFWVRECF